MNQNLSIPKDNPFIYGEKENKVILILIYEKNNPKPNVLINEGN